MYIKNIKLRNFRNIEKMDIDLGKDINIFFGENAQGKTNIIESIYISSIGKSYRTSSDNELIKINEEFSIIEIEFVDNRNKKIILRMPKDKKKYFELNGIKQKK